MIWMARYILWDYVWQQKADLRRIDLSVPNSKGDSGMKIIPGMELEDRGNEGEVKTSPSNLTEKEVSSTYLDVSLTF